LWRAKDGSDGKSNVRSHPSEETLLKIDHRDVKLAEGGVEIRAPLPTAASARKEEKSLNTTRVFRRVVPKIEMTDVEEAVTSTAPRAQKIKEMLPSVVTKEAAGSETALSITRTVAPWLKIAPPLLEATALESKAGAVRALGGVWTCAFKSEGPAQRSSGPTRGLGDIGTERSEAKGENGPALDDERAANERAVIFNFNVRRGGGWGTYCAEG
jgi:hypothetical protein